MHSISSNDNDYCAGYCYDSSFRVPENVPYYPYVGGQPIVYYSLVAQDHPPQRNKVTKKNNHNCFVKAFRWYTQELPSTQLVAPYNNANIGGFATWLDKKYEEYIQDSQCGNNCMQYRSKQCSFTKSDRTINRIEYPSRKTRKFPRLKSPWKKKRRYINETERDMECEKKSFEYILRPQDMSRPASECCQKTSFCVRSDTTFITSKCAIPTNIKKKSKSLICISKLKDEFEKDIMMTNYEVSQCNNKQQIEETSRIGPNPPSMKTNTKKIICDCYNTDLKAGMHYQDMATTNQGELVHCQCETNYIPVEIENHSIFKKVSCSKLHENTREFNKRNKTQRSREQSWIVKDCNGVTNQKNCSVAPNKLTTKNVTCECDIEASRRNVYEPVTCQCSTSNFRNDEVRDRIKSNMSAVIKKISRNDFNRNEYDDNKYMNQKQTSKEMTRIVTKCSKQTNEMQAYNTRTRRQSRDVVCECNLYSRDFNNPMTQNKLATKEQTKMICQCPKNYVSTSDRQQFESKKMCRKTTQENFNETCCPCPKPLEPRLQPAPQIRRSSTNFNGMKTLNYKEPFNSKQLPVQGVQTSDHSIRFQEDSFFVKIV